jgi:hypothetical protein
MLIRIPVPVIFLTSKRIFPALIGNIAVCNVVEDVVIVPPVLVHYSAISGIPKFHELEVSVPFCM